MARAIKIGLLILTGLLFGAPSCEDNKQDGATDAVTGVAGTDTLFSQSLADRLSESELRSFEAIAVQKLNDFTDLAMIVHDVTLDTTFRINAARMIRDLFTSASINLIAPSGNSGQANGLTLDQFLSDGLRNKDSWSTFSTDSLHVIQPLISDKDSAFSGTIGFLLQDSKAISRGQKTSPMHLSVRMNLIRMVKNFGDEKLRVWEIRLGEMKAVNR